MPYPTKPKGGWQRPCQVVVNKSSIEGEQGHTQVHEQVPQSISDQYGTGVQQPSGSLSLSGRRQNVCLAARRNAEEYSVEPSVPENAKRLPS